MARVPYVEPVAGESAPELRRLYEEIGARRGAVLNRCRALANQPPALPPSMARC